MTCEPINADVYRFEYNNRWFILEVHPVMGNIFPLDSECEPMDYYPDGWWEAVDWFVHLNDEEKEKNRL